MIYISQALASLYPEAQFVMEDEDYEKIRWTANKPDPMPTLQQLKDEAKRLEELEKATEYQTLRRNEYPPLSDLADAIYWQANGDNTKMANYLARVEMIKNKYPKGTS